MIATPATLLAAPIIRVAATAVSVRGSRRILRFAGPPSTLHVVCWLLRIITFFNKGHVKREQQPQSAR